MNFKRLDVVLSCVLSMCSLASAQDSNITEAPRLDLMLAPVALYPDIVLSEILEASSYPSQLQDAERWLADPSKASSTSDVVRSSLDMQPWDPSVKSLVAFPAVVQRLADNLDWTQSVGSAFTNQQQNVLVAVQDLRVHAQEAGSLHSTDQERVLINGSFISIEPTDLQHIQIPDYDPMVVYGPWRVGYTPFTFSHDQQPVYVQSAPVTIQIVQPYWGSNDVAQHRHSLQPGYDDRSYADGRLSGDNNANTPRNYDQGQQIRERPAMVQTVSSSQAAPAAQQSRSDDIPSMRRTTPLSQSGTNATTVPAQSSSQLPVSSTSTREVTSQQSLPRVQPAVESAAPTAAQPSASVPISNTHSSYPGNN